MSLKNIFLRNKPITPEDINQSIVEEKVMCDTEKLKKLLTKWISREGWEYDDLVDFFELIGVRTPVKLSELEIEDESFKCLTADNKEVQISICFSTSFKAESEIYVTEGEVTKGYSINYNYWIGKDMPKVTLISRKIERDGKELSSCYKEDSCNRTLKLDSTHVLKVKIDEPKNNGDKSEKFVLRNCLEIENYLIGLDNSLVISQVYNTVMKLYTFSDEDITKCGKILFSYVEDIDGEERILNKILLKNGEMQEYAIFENGETFHVFKDGSWRYFSGGMRIFYFEEKKQHVFSITGEEDIVKVNLSEIMGRVKKKISELWELVFSTKE